jgi:8-oxo-dGTP pyrophosphatase MutT (NUDIX family)
VLSAESSRLAEVLGAYVPRSAEEAEDVERLRRLVAEGVDPWTRASPLHVTGSAVVVHPPSERVLLRWHQRQQGWLQVGGHGDPGESDPFEIALREAREETGLLDLAAWPDPDEPSVVQIAVVPVPAGKNEPAHHHGDIRYTLATAQPELAVAESAKAALAWLTLDEALERVGEDNLRACLERIRMMFSQH